MDDLEQAHLDYEKRKGEVLEDLQLLYDSTYNSQVKKILKRAIEFIKEREI